MKPRFLAFMLVSLSFLSCKKSDADIPYGNSVNYAASQPTYSPGGPYSFTEITVDPATIKIGKPATLTAKATGVNLTFTWSTSHGDLFGSGASIYYSDSCIGTYTVTCVVSDGTHTKTITVPITVAN